MFNSKFQKVYRKLIAQQMENIPSINAEINDKRIIITYAEGPDFPIQKIDACELTKQYEQYKAGKIKLSKENVGFADEYNTELQKLVYCTGDGYLKDYIDTPSFDQTLKLYVDYLNFLRENNIQVELTGSQYGTLYMEVQFGISDLNLIKQFLSFWFTTVYIDPSKWPIESYINETIDRIKLGIKNGDNEIDVTDIDPCENYGIQIQIQ